MPTDPVPETTSEWLSERASRRRGAIAEDRVIACDRCGFEAEMSGPCCTNEGLCHVCGCGQMRRVDMCNA